MVTIKHFVANEQEHMRDYGSSGVSERAMREIYLKPFEISVKFANALGIMTSNNRVNQSYTMTNYELNTVVLREQWGFEGYVMTDWLLNSDDNTIAAMVRAQNDLCMPGQIMPGMTLGTGGGADLLKAVINSDDAINSVTRGEVQRNVKNVLRTVMRSNTFARDNDIPNNPMTVEKRVFTVGGEGSSLQ
jgi:beta-glucosidase